MNRSLLILLLSFLSAMSFAQALSGPKQDSVSIPAKDTARIGFAVSGYFGGGLASANAGDPDPKALQYSNLSNAHFPNSNYTSSGGLNIGFSLDLLFGKKRNMELSLGLLYLYSKGTAGFDGFHVEYEAQDAMGNPFRRLLTATHAGESLSFSNVVVPLLFKYSTNPDKKLGAFFQLGPVLSVSATSSGTMNATMDFEAVYHYDAASNKYTYSPASAPGDWVLTRKAVAAELAPDQSVDAYFAQHYARGYYVGLDKSQTGNAAKISYKIGGGMQIRAGGVYRANKIVSILFGANIIILSNGQNTHSFTPVSAGNDLNTISLSNFMQGTSSLFTMQAGVNIGLQIRIVQ